ncbi:MAG: DUF116 domain-containing protein, partial [Phycisphaerae bacterium]|nr:DUF116 domain-containing protein [Phycisphaerae bacterium]
MAQDSAVSKVIASRPKMPPQDNITQTRLERDRILRIIQQYVRDNGLVPPLGFEELQTHTQNVIAKSNSQEKFKDYIVVLLSNEAWRETLARIPYDRRLLLLPQCLRFEERCKAEMDELGLICAHCGSCQIHNLQTEAERLGYVVMVAEGSPVVMSLIETGQVEAIVGVSCLSVLERVFPYMEAAAVPGMAFPLLQDGCKDTNVDLDWVWDAIYLTSDDKTRR